MKLYLGKTNGVVDFNLGRTSEGVIDFVFNVLRSVAKKRLNQNTSSTGNKKSKKPISSLSSDVLEINDDNFDETVMKDNKSVWLLELYAPWCGHCKALTPIWEDVATKLKNKVKVAKIDATVSVSLAAKFSVKGYPTLILLPSGEKSISAGIPYNGPRKSESIVSFAMGFASDAVKASQLLSDKQFHDECDKGVCIISFLPHLIDSGAEGRKNYLKQLNGAFKASSAMPVKFFWVQAGDNLELEESLRLQFGWPAVIATRLDKSKYSIHKGDFSDESIRSFLTGLMAGRNTLSPIPETLPKFSSTIEWDGKDFSAEENLSKSKDEL